MLIRNLAIPALCGLNPSRVGVAGIVILVLIYNYFPELPRSRACRCSSLSLKDPQIFDTRIRLRTPNLLQTSKLLLLLLIKERKLRIDLPILIAHFCRLVAVVKTIHMILELLHEHLRVAYQRTQVWLF